MHRRLSVFGHRLFTNSSLFMPSSWPLLNIQSCTSEPRVDGLALFRVFMFTSTHPRRVPNPDDPSTLMKEDGVAVCSQMWIKNFREPDKTVTNLTNHLRRFELWVMAYQKVCADEMGAYVPRNTIQRSALEDLLALRNAVLDSRFKWGARLEFFIKSPKDKMEYESLSKRKIRAILTTTQPSPFQDRIVQEVLLMVLEPIYEARFSQKSFAFRPGRNAHTVLRVIRRSFAGYLWYIKGDLSTILDGMKLGMVISALTRDVRDEKVIDLTCYHHPTW